MEPIDLVRNLIRVQAVDPSPNNVFSHHLQIGRPYGGGSICSSRGGVSDSGEIVYQCLKPDIHGMIWIIRYRNTPRKPAFGTRNRQVLLRIAVKSVKNFLISGWRVDEVRIVFHVPKELVAERGQAEHIVFFLSPLNRGPGFERNEMTFEIITRWSNLDNLGVGIETFVCDGVPPGMLPFVYEAFLFEEVLSVRVSKRESNESSTRTQTCLEAR